MLRNKAADHTEADNKSVCRKGADCMAAVRKEERYNMTVGDFDSALRRAADMDYFHTEVCWEDIPLNLYNSAVRSDRTVEEHYSPARCRMDYTVDSSNSFLCVNKQLFKIRQR